MLEGRGPEVDGEVACEDDAGLLDVRLLGLEDELVLDLQCKDKDPTKYAYGLSSLHCLCDIDRLGSAVAYGGCFSRSSRGRDDCSA